MTATATTPATQPAPSAAAQPAAKPADPFPLAQKLVQAVGLPRHPEMPEDFDGRWQRAQIYAASGLMPKGMDTPEKVFIALDIGAALGLSAMMSVQNIAVINGRPSVMFQVKLGIAMSTGQLEQHGAVFSGAGETLACTYTVKRKGYAPVSKTFSHADAKRADLLGKDNWKKYEPDMLTARAGDRAVKDAFAELFAGLSAPDDAGDEADEPASVTPSKPKTPPVPTFRMTERLWSDVKLLAAHRKLDGPGLAEVIREATGGREVARDAKGVPAFTKEEHDAIRRWIEGWKPTGGAAKPASGPTAAPQPAPQAAAALDAPDGVNLFEAGAEPDVTDAELDAEGR